MNLNKNEPFKYNKIQFKSMINLKLNEKYQKFRKWQI